MLFLNIYVGIYVYIYDIINYIVFLSVGYGLGLGYDASTFLDYRLSTDSSKYTLTFVSVNY